jgi:hypothetical protein
MITFDDIGIVHVIKWRQECREWEKGAGRGEGDDGMKRHVNSIGLSEKSFCQNSGKGVLSQVLFWVLGMLVDALWPPRVALRSTPGYAFRHSPPGSSCSR